MTDETGEAADATLDELLGYLRRDRGFDFSGYKPAGLERRVRKRMQAAGVGTFAEYVDYLEVHPDEFVHLFNTILINVTGFFRDPPVWQALAADVVPRVAAAKAGHESIRVWSAGCASGEEAYSMAILLAEALGVEAFRERVKIYGTDVDEEALDQARQAVYPARALEDVPPALQEKYFEAAGDRRLFRKDLRRNVIFGRHDLFQDAPISRLDLLVCRNCLMYFNAEAQARIMERFHFAVNEGGYLVLGRAEMLLTHGNTFAPGRPEAAGVPEGAARPGPRADVGGGRRRPRRRAGGAAGQRGAAAGGRVRLRPGAQLVLDAQGCLTLANLHARTLFGVGASDAGRPLADLDIAARLPDVRAAVGQAVESLRTVVLREIEWRRPAGGAEYFDAHVVPMRDRRGQRPARRDGHVHQRHPGPAAARGAEARQPRARSRLRGAAVVQRGAGDHQRGAAVDRGGAGDDQRGAAAAPTRSWRR